MKFGLIGDGAIAQFHRKAIKSVGGTLAWVYDPKYEKDVERMPVDYTVICSPTYLHRDHILESLSWGDVIVEKPMCLPWQPIIDNHRINVVLQYRWADLPEHAETVRVRMVRDEAYFQTWKGDPTKTGGVFFNLFIHYIDLAIRLGANFEGHIAPDGAQERWVDDFDLMKVDMQGCYNRMYAAILDGKGVKPKDLFLLHWLLERQGDIFGYGKNAMNKTILVDRQLV